LLVLLSSFLPLFHLGPQPPGGCHSHPRWVLPSVESPSQTPRGGLY
jgi:hypothetical protein